MMLEEIPAKTILGRTKDTSWFGTDYNMNLYRGCCHGCIYCDSRSSCYGIEEFDRIRIKKDALRLLRDDLRRKVRSGVIMTGSMSDPYNPFEKELQLTRHALELIDAFSFGVAIATKSDLIVRDKDILQSIKDYSPVLCKITITTASDELSAQVEPNAPSSSRRFAAISELSQAGIYAGILLMPVLPFLEDNEENVLAIVERASECGAKFIYPAFGMTMRDNQREWYLAKLTELFPAQHLSEKYLCRYGTRYQCTSPHAGALWKSFKERCQEKGILYDMRDIISGYQAGYGARQLSFLE